MTTRHAPAPVAEPADEAGRLQIQLLHVPGCPLVDHVRATLHDTFRQAGLSLPVEELEGPYPSPTLLIDGIDVTGRTATPEASCRLDLPTPQQILDALASQRS